ncbi:MAG: DUF5723 family protein [Bacteroidales bacterium]|nr:DUF5723 family protein [Bacteroidales bacterium]
MKQFTCILAFLFLQINSFSQDMLGSVLGNYAGINSLQLNPSALLNSKIYFDIRLIGSNVFIDNNAIYLSKDDYRFSNFFTPGYEFPSHKETYGTEDRYFYMYDNTKPKNAFINIQINGPGAMMIWRHHAFAINTAIRTVFSMRKIPYDIANFALRGLNYLPQHNIAYNDDTPFLGSGMVWSEIGLAYAYTIYAEGNDKISAGINIKRLYSAGGIFINVDHMDYTALNDSTMDIRSLTLDAGLSLPLNYSSNEFEMDPIIKGKGFGLDIGLTYTRLSPHHQKQYFSTACSQQYENYIYRLGLALIDFGGIRFNDNAEKLKIDNKPAFWEHLNRFDFSNIQKFLDTVSYKFYQDTTSLYADNKFFIFLPTTLSFQFDYHIKNNWFINASFLYGLNMGKQSIVRPSQISITPRYESEWFEASFPVSLYDFTWPRVGASLRFYGFTIGTDNLGGFFSWKDFTGLDFYFSVRYFILAGKCRNIKIPMACP